MRWGSLACVDGTRGGMATNGVACMEACVAVYMSLLSRRSRVRASMCECASPFASCSLVLSADCPGATFQRQQVPTHGYVFVCAFCEMRFRSLANTPKVREAVSRGSACFLPCCTTLPRRSQPTQHECLAGTGFDVHHHQRQDHQPIRPSYRWHVHCPALVVHSISTA